MIDKKLLTEDERVILERLCLLAESLWYEFVKDVEDCSDRIFPTSTFDDILWTSRQ